MGYVSTNTLGATHFQGALVVGGGKATGRNAISLDPVSTGSTPMICAQGDDANVSIQIMPKGTGQVVIGSSGTAFGGILRGASTFLYPNLAASAWGASTVTAPGVSTGSVVMVQVPSSMSTALIMTGAYASGTDEITVGFLNNVASTIGGGLSTSDVLRWAAITF